MKNKKAFSLIELSIVLIIIGLLVAGITGGANLIESARIRAFINELNSYKQAVAAFKVAKGRLPGDLNEDGFTGFCRGEQQPNNCNQTYKIGDFSAPYDKVVPNNDSSIYVELYLEKLIDFKPDENNITTSGKSTPFSKVFVDKSKNNGGLFFFTTFANTTESSTHTYADPIKYGDVFLDYYYNNFNPEIFKKIDTMIDDGAYNSGSIRGWCDGSADRGYNSYDNSIENNKKCQGLFYKLNL